MSDYLMDENCCFYTFDVVLIMPSIQKMIMKIINMIGRPKSSKKFTIFGTILFIDTYRYT